MRSSHKTTTLAGWIIKIMNKNNKLQKGIFFTDIHFGRRSNSVTHNEDCIAYIEWLCDNVKKHGADYLAFLGDWNENRNSLNIQTLNYSYKAAKMLNDLGIPVYFVVGNHDLYYRHSREIHSVVPFNEFDNFVVIDSPTVVDDIQDGMLFCPYLFHDEYAQLAQYNHVPFWAGHFEFRGFVVTGYSVTMPTGPDPKDYNGPRYVASGHFHKRQAHENIVYIGNTFPMDFGDAGDDNRGFMMYDHQKDEMTFEDWAECPKYRKTTLSELLDPETRTNVLSLNARVKCMVDIPISFEESTYLREKFIEDYSLRELSMEETPDIQTALSDTETDIDWDNEELSNVKDLVFKMLSNIETAHIDNELLIRLYQDVKHRASSLKE